uniref:mitogen-activated protein kinase kinase n=1 Tax=Anthurium amnicola TaxID=1678845 RepID=A0A1D1Z959_9ARAE
MPLPPKATPEAGMKRGDNKPRVPPALSVPISEVSFGKFLTHCGTFKDGDLLVNKDGLRIVRQNGEPAQPLIKPSDNQLALDDMDMIQVIGKGTSGIVQLVRHKWTEQFFALKAIQLSNILEETRKQIAQELKINYSINHSSQCPYIVAYYQSFYDNGVITIVLEYMDGGSLADFLKKVKSIPEPYLAAICKQVLKGLIYLHHEKRIVHRDLKPANLLINHRGEVKITDFGVSATLESSSGQRETFVGTCSYMSPERIMGGRHGPLSDIWSLGLVLLECATGQFPYAHPDGQEAYNSVFELLEAIVLRPPPCAPSDMFSEEFCSFISACIQQEPKDRKSALELMEHSFLTMYEGENVDLASYFTKAGPPLATF